MPVLQEMGSKTMPQRVGTHTKVYGTECSKLLYCACCVTVPASDSLLSFRSPLAFSFGADPHDAGLRTLLYSSIVFFKTRAPSIPMALPVPGLSHVSSHLLRLALSPSRYNRTGFRSVFRILPEGLGGKDNTKAVVVVLVVRVVVVAIG